MPVASAKISKLSLSYLTRDSLGRAEFELKWKPMTNSKSPYAW